MGFVKLYLDLLRDLQRVIDLDTQVPDRALEPMYCST